MNDSFVMPNATEKGRDSSLKAGLRRAERLYKAKSLALIAPLFLFVLTCFAFPIGTMLSRSVDNPEVHTALPQTSTLLASWKGTELPPEPVFGAMVEDLRSATDSGSAGALVKRLSYENPALRSLFNKTMRQLPEADVPSKQEALREIDAGWSEVSTWRSIKQASSAVTSYYLLAAMDRRVDTQTGEIVKASPNQAIYIDIFMRTFQIGGIVTILCIVLGFPVAYWLSTLPDHRSNLLMIMVLLPFWTSLIVRTASWIVLLQSDGLINRSLMALGITDAPLQLVFNRIGVVIAMTHVLLPFMILPLYSVMKSISPSYVRAAVSLGAHPFVAFVRVYVPQTFAGLAAGGILTFIMAIGYYVTPALVGGAADQMVSYFVAFYTNKTVNWGMASALGALLLVATLILYFVYTKLLDSSASKAR